MQEASLRQHSRHIMEMPHDTKTLLYITPPDLRIKNTDLLVHITLFPYFRIVNGELHDHCGNKLVWQKSHLYIQ